MTKILVIDNDKMTSELLSAWLGAKGYTVESAEDGMQGLEKFIALRPQLVITEIILPVMNGYPLIKQIREHCARHNFSSNIIVLTSIRQAEARAWCRSLGATDYITKPYSPLKLESRIEKQLNYVSAI